jgi:hypothetical protein
LNAVLLVFLAQEDQGKYKTVTPVITHNESRPLHLVIILPKEGATDERAVYTLSVGVAMYCFNEVGMGVARRPDGEGDETVLPADAGERELAVLLVSDPI